MQNWKADLGAQKTGGLRRCWVRYPAGRTAGLAVVEAHRLGGGEKELERGVATNQE